MNRFSALCAVVIAACTACALAQDTDPQKGQRVTVPREERARLQKPPNVTPVVPNRSTVPDTTAHESSGESHSVPKHILSLVLADAARRTATSTQAITVADSQAVTWPDGSLGCPERDVTYTQLPVSGYRVVVNAQGRAYDYRVGTAAQATGAETSGAAVQIRICDSMHGIRALEQPAPAPKQQR